MSAPSSPEQTPDHLAPETGTQAERDSFSDAQTISVSSDVDSVCSSHYPSDRDGDNTDERPVSLPINASNASVRCQALLQNAFRAGLYTDSVVETESGASFPVHRAVLAQLAPFFHTAFGGGFSESERRVVRIHQAEDDAVLLLLKFAYGGDAIVAHACATSLTCALNTWKLAHRFGIRPLMSLAAAEATGHPCVETCIDVLRHARLYHCDSSALLMFEFIAFNFGSVTQTQAFTGVSSAELDLLLSSTELIASERELLDAILRWAKHDLPVRTHSMEQLMLRHLVAARLEPRDVAVLVQNASILPRTVLADALASTSARLVPVRGLAPVKADCELVKCLCPRPKYSGGMCCLYRLSRNKSEMHKHSRSFRVSMVHSISPDPLWNSEFLLPLPLAETVGKCFFYRRFPLSVLNIAMSLFFVLDMNAVEGSPLSLDLVVDRRVAAVGDKKDLFSEVAHLCSLFDVKVLSPDGYPLCDTSERIPLTTLCERSDSTFSKKCLGPNDFPLNYSKAIDLPCTKEDLDMWRHSDQDHNMLLNITLSKIPEL